MGLWTWNVSSCWIKHVCRLFLPWSLYLVVAIQLSFLKPVFFFSSLGVSLPAMKSFGKSCRPGFYIKKLNRTCLNLFLNSSFGTQPPSFYNVSRSCVTLCEYFCHPLPPVCYFCSVLIHGIIQYMKFRLKC